MSDFKFEKSHLENVIDELKENRGCLLKKLERVNQTKMDPELATALTNAYNRQILDIDNHGNSPYFAKLVYKDDQESKEEELYIGKVGFFNSKDEQIVIDWRAPISTLYYDSEVGRVEYSSPEGLKQGELNLKRQLIVENNTLLSMTDSDLMTNDELLRPYLNQNADKRLKTIIATIQSEQNKIIRAPRKNMVVQGIAGSGKTTVALHRLSYLIYQMKKFDTTSDFLIVGPNKIFLQYISSVLPDLDTGDASQFTYEEIAKEVVGENFKVADKNNVLKELVSSKSAPEYLKRKTDLSFKDKIDEFLFDIADKFLPNNINFKGAEIFSKGQLKEFYNQNRGGDLQSEFIRLSNFLAGRLSNPKISRDILADVSRQARENVLEIGLKDEWKLRDMFEKGSQDFLKKQIVFKKLSVFGVYSDFLKWLKNDSEYVELADATLENIKHKLFDYEDLPALIYIKQCLLPCKKFDNICHVIIDEAQDLGLFHYEALKKLFNGCIFDLYGDLNQAIYGYSSIKDWKEVDEKVLQCDSQYYELTKSYRTTIEIMEAANLVGNSITLVKGQPVIRHGEKVEVFEYSKDDYEKIMVETVKASKEKFSVVAILCMNNKECESVQKLLERNDIESTVLKDDSKITGVVISTVYQSKGLEFDSVILNDASEKQFDQKSEVEMKLLYVALTRAMHELKILSKGKVVSVLQSLKDNV